MAQELEVDTFLGRRVDSQPRAQDIGLDADGAALEIRGLTLHAPLALDAKPVTVQIRKEKTVKVKVGKMEEPEKIASRKGSEQLDELGLEVQDATPAVLQRFGLEDTDGVIVTKVRPVSPAGDAGLRPGDVILEAAREKVDSAEELRERLEDEDKVILLIGRGDSTLYATLSRS